MKPTTFEGHNIVLGKNQPQYLPLPALRCDDTNGTVWTCWELDANDIGDVLNHRRLWVGQLSFGKPFSPQMITTSVPLEVAVAAYKAKESARAAAPSDDPEEVLP